MINLQSWWILFLKLWVCRLSQCHSPRFTICFWCSFTVKIWFSTLKFSYQKTLTLFLAILSQTRDQNEIDTKHRLKHSISSTSQTQAPHLPLESNPYFYILSAVQSLSIECFHKQLKYCKQGGRNKLKWEALFQYRFLQLSRYLSELLT